MRWRAESVGVMVTREPEVVMSALKPSQRLDGRGAYGEEVAEHAQRRVARVGVPVEYVRIGMERRRRCTRSLHRARRAVQTGRGDLEQVQVARVAPEGGQERDGGEARLVQMAHALQPLDLGRVEHIPPAPCGAAVRPVRNERIDAEDRLDHRRRFGRVAVEREPDVEPFLARRINAKLTRDRRGIRLARPEVRTLLHLRIDGGGLYAPCGAFALEIGEGGARGRWSLP